MIYKLKYRKPVLCHDSKFNGKKVRCHYFNNIRVSTAFISFDHGLDSEQPILFETMIFGGKADGYALRCSTWRQALIQHRKLISEIKNNKLY